MVAWLHGHLDPGLLPPVEPRPDREHDPLLRGRIMGAGGHDESGPAHPVLIELLDHYLVEERPKLMPTSLYGLASRSRVHGAEDIHGRLTDPARTCHIQATNLPHPGVVCGEHPRQALAMHHAPRRPPSRAENRSIRPMAEQVDSRSCPDALVASLAAVEWSVLSLDELRACGLSPDQVTHRLRKGWLHRVYPGVYAVGHPAISTTGRLLAAVKSIGRGAVLSHFSAAALWGFVDWDRRYPEVTVRGTGAKSHHGIRVHCTSVLEPRDISRHEGIPVTSAERTLVDLASVANHHLLRRAVRKAQSLRRVSVPGLVVTMRRLGPRRGTANLNRMLATGPAPTRSELEDVVFDLIIDGGLAPPDVNKALHIAGRRVVPDFRWPEQRVVVEADSRIWHDNRIAREDDAERQALLEAHGERVLRVTWKQAVTTPAETLARIRAAGAPGRATRG
jgi:very-short-patch-repair endonuclease